MNGPGPDSPGEDGGAGEEEDLDGRTGRERGLAGGETGPNDQEGGPAGQTTGRGSLLNLVINVLDVDDNPPRYVYTLLTLTRLLTLYVYNT